MLAALLPGYYDQRFPDPYDRPKLKAWRCVLTALSQTCNYYFVACNDTIHMYQPNFPDQGLPSEPELVLSLPKSSSVGGPGIDPQDPHSITRILVGYLGHDEVLLATCDDGDVIGYRVKEIQKALNSLPKSNLGEDPVVVEDNIKPFLHRNVGASAWGLAIHREARMIAISANTHHITVLAYALSHPVSDSDSSASSEFNTSECDPLADFPSPRRQDHVIILKAENNIPAVSFNNNGDDPFGRWLFSSGIDGKTLIWDIHNHRMFARSIHLGWCASTQSSTWAPSLGPFRTECECSDARSYPHGVWGAAMLDTRAAYELSRLEEESLVRPERILPTSPWPCGDEFTRLNDVSKHKEQFTVRNYRYRPSATDLDAFEVSSDSDNVASVMMLQQPDSEDMEESTSDLEEVQDEEISADAMMMMQQGSEDMEENTSNSEQGQDEELGSDADSDVMSIEHEDAQDTISADAAESQDSHNDSLFVPETGTIYALNPTETVAEDILQMAQIQNELLTAWDNSDASSDEEEVLFVPPPPVATINPRRIMRVKHPFCEISALNCSPPPDNLPTGPCLILTKEEIYLVQQPFQLRSTSDSDFIGPIVSMRRPLHPERHAPPLGSHDRMCYFEQIPELGVFIAASPLGRAAVFSIYWMKVKGSAVPQYGYKLEYLLPFEGKNEKEVCDWRGGRLVGLAVGPVQGMFDVPTDVEEVVDDESLPQSRRWRILMYYTDHTVLSFEISKQRATQSPALSELVV
ncbi:hypothetical protein N0V83_005383 [Neocucurbitaria cava]|uniref:Uncharacterized protein n=1 Tax=Neocucurbitaria cava TaxID=798079 RepID=A0A9W8Y7U2_9PLEO|nr:hypothetical protein N0V83_005383 [Neocucurbitaria cava]